MTQVINKKSTNKKYLTLALIAPLTALAGSGSIPASATSSATSFSVNAMNTLSLEVSDESVVMNVTPTADGVFNSTSLTVGVGTNNDTGYTLSMMTNKTDLYRTMALSNGNIPTINTLADDNNGLGYTENDTAFLNHWGYNIGTNNNHYLPLSPIIEELSKSTTPVNSSDATTTINLATKLNNEIPSGTYTTTLTFVAIANYIPSTCNPNTICYNGNGADTGTSIADQSANNGSSTMLRANNFKKGGYGFAGWSIEQNPSNQNGTNTYGPNQTVTLTNALSTNTSDGGLVLYARWIPTQGYMQNFTIEQCNAMNLNDVIALTDSRDNNVYAIAKLPNTYSTETGQYTDGTCWMIENLRLNNEYALTEENTHNPLLPLTNDDSTTSNYLSATSSSWCTTNSSACDNQSKLNTSNTTNTTIISTNNTTIYGYGNYYNWYSATGGWGEYKTTYYFNSNGELIGTKVENGEIDGTDEGADPTKTIVTSTNATSMPGDICPAGWRLPIGGSYSIAGGQTINTQNSDFYKLMYALQHNNAPDQTSRYNQHYYSDATGAAQNLRKYPNNFLFSGDWNGTGPTNRGSYGYYWSSTVYGANVAYNLGFNSDYVYPGTDNLNK